MPFVKTSFDGLRMVSKVEPQRTPRKNENEKSLRSWRLGAMRIRNRMRAISRKDAKGAKFGEEGKIGEEIILSKGQWTQSSEK